MGVSGGGRAGKCKTSQIFISPAEFLCRAEVADPTIEK
jgi:hypothetical protein